MLIYEVNLQIKSQIYTAYLNWLGAHIQEVLVNPGFVKAEVFETPDAFAQMSGEQEPTQNLVVQYSVESQQALDLYLTQHAPRMRAQAVTLFDNQFSAMRRILYKKSQLSPNLCIVEPESL